MTIISFTKFIILSLFALHGIKFINIISPSIYLFTYVTKGYKIAQYSQQNDSSFSFITLPNILVYLLHIRIKTLSALPKIHCHGFSQQRRAIVVQNS